MRTIKRNGYIFQVCHEHPTRRFKGSSGPKMGPKPDPKPTVRQVDEETRAKDIEKRRQRIASAGRGGTILTERNKQDFSGASLLGRSS